MDFFPAREQPGQGWPRLRERVSAEGRIVLVDFTAKWCVTCQANKATSVEVAAVEARLKELNAVVLLGDFTRKDPLIRVSRAHQKLWQLASSAFSVLGEARVNDNGPAGAANKLGLNPATLYSRMKKLGIQRPGNSLLASGRDAPTGASR